MSDTHKAKIVKAEPAAVTEGQPMHPLVTAAIASGEVDAQTMRDLLAVQREWEAGEAKKAYVRAMARLKAELPSVIERDQIVDFSTSRGRVHYTHASLAQVVEQVVGILTDHGFSHSWIPSVGDKDRVSVTCRLVHVEGHSEECVINADPDKSGSKSQAQGIASTITLLQRYSLLALLGIATADQKEPAGEPTPDPDAINTRRNLNALKRLKELGVTQSEAEEHVQRTIDKWTAEDLEEIGKLVASKTPQTEEEHVS